MLTNRLGMAIARFRRPVLGVPPSPFDGAQIGDEIGGGVYAGIDTIGGTDYHVISGKAESETYGLEWKTSMSNTAGATSDTDGLANTQAMESAGIADHPAAQHCVNYAGGGHNDWHMPARSQLTLMYNNLAGHAEFSVNTASGDYTWASDENDWAGAWLRRFSDGNVDLAEAAKTSTDKRVRPIRRVEVAPPPPPTEDFSTATIGDEVGGGIYAGTITYADAREFHLVFAKQDGESAVGPEWGNYGTTTGADDPDDGKANQDLILASFDDGSADAFYHCRDFTDGAGNADYYLPSRNEIVKVDALVTMSHAEFSTDLSTYRWSSTESTSDRAWIRKFSDGNEVSNVKNDTNLRVRPVRRVPV